MDMSTEEGIFAGYALGCKTYRGLNPTTETVKICNIVCTDEKGKSSTTERKNNQESTPTEENRAQKECN